MKLPTVGEGSILFPGLLNYSIDTYFIILSFKQGGSK